MAVVARVGADQPVVGLRADVEGPGTSARTGPTWTAPAHRFTRCFSQSSNTAVTNAQPNRKSSTGMSHGNRIPDVLVVVDDDRRRQLGQPAVDGHLKPSTITIDIQ